jgi:hypothetical protein
MAFRMEYTLKRTQFIRDIKRAKAEIDAGPMPIVTVPPTVCQPQTISPCVWLSSKTVKAFDVEGFTELGEKEASELNGCVDQFQKAAAKVQPTDSPTNAQYLEARSAFDALWNCLVDLKLIAI